MLLTGLILATFAILGNINPSWPQAFSAQIQPTPTPIPTPTPDPSKDFNSLDNNISYSFPLNWQKSDHIDKLGENTYLKFTSSDFISPEPGAVDQGIGIVISRTYDLNSESSLKSKLDKVYDFNTYNVMPIKIDNKNAMTMQQEGDGYRRFIYIATQNHLWEIIIASKSLEEQARYEAEISQFLNSIKLKS